ncbi:MAG: hypothetical protein A2Z66_05940 [Chloroflexi bacterium RBG_13_66_10]|nr:MAG: hypothetical protein A2Z66_05940 [Chloroflexi bacterium RBG_13_66_10]
MASSTPPRGPGRSTGSSAATRLAATLILIPAVPLLVASVVALALHYASPARFSQWIARLPGEEAIRIVLAFAPATLFAIVVLAFLYARDAGTGVPARAAPAHPARGGKARPIAVAVLTIVVPLLVISVAALGLSFVSPDRFHQIIDPLPGTFLLLSGVRFAPLVLAALALPALYVAVVARGMAGRPVEVPWKAARLSVGMVLVPTVPMLIASLAGLALLYFAPGRLEGWLAALTGEGFIRLVLALAPVALFAVVLLALLYLSSSGRSFRPSSVSSAARSRLGVLILAGGLTLTGLAGVGLLGAAILAFLH